MDQAAAMLGVSASSIKSSTRVGNGTYYTLNGYYVYVPDDVSSDTEAFIYYPGSGGAFPNDARKVKEFIESGNANQIIVISNDAYSPKDSGGEYLIQTVKNIASYNNTEVTRIDNMCFSASGPSGFTTIVNLASKDPETHHTAVFADVVGFSPSESQIETLKNSDTSLLFVEPRGTVEYFESTLAKNGVDVYIAWAADGSHIACNRDIIQGGLISFLSGESDTLTNASSYKFVKYDASTGKWVEVSFDEVAEKFNVESSTDPLRYYDKLSKISDLESNNSFIKEHINEIRSCIRNSEFLSATSFETYSSTTQIPNAEGEIVLNFFSECSMLLNKLEKDTVSIVQIGDGIKELNDTAENEANDLNNTTSNPTTSGDTSTYYNPTSGTPTSGTPTSGTPTATATPTPTATDIPTSTEQPTEPELSEEEKARREKIEAIKKKVYEEKDLYTDSEKYVYEAKDGHKVVIHYDDKGVLGLEYYYFYDSEEDAKNNIEVLKDKFANVEDVVQEGNTLKVIFKDKLYKDAKVEDVKNRYSEMTEVSKPEDVPNEKAIEPVVEEATPTPTVEEPTVEEPTPELPEGIAELEREFELAEANKESE